MTPVWAKMHDPRLLPPGKVMESWPGGEAGSQAGLQSMCIRGRGGQKVAVRWVSRACG